MLYEPFCEKCKLRNVECGGEYKKIKEYILIEKSANPFQFERRWKE
jgi:hypothetical protein